MEFVNDEISPQLQEKQFLCRDPPIELDLNLWIHSSSLLLRVLKGTPFLVRV